MCHDSFKIAGAATAAAAEYDSATSEYIKAVLRKARLVDMLLNYTVQKSLHSVLCFVAAPTVSCW